VTHSRLSLVQALDLAGRGVFARAQNLVIVSFGTQLCSGILEFDSAIFNQLSSEKVAANFTIMSEQFAPGDDLIFQLESGYGLLRVIAIDERDGKKRWHLSAYEELFGDVESAERALANPHTLHIRKKHMALTDRAFERTPAARIGNRPVTDHEREMYEDWRRSGAQVSDRSALLMLGLR
jgi:hypothetical protein